MAVCSSLLSNIDIGTFVGPAADDDPLVLGAMLVVLTSEARCETRCGQGGMLRIKPVEMIDDQSFKFGCVFEGNCASARWPRTARAGGVLYSC